MSISINQEVSFQDANDIVIGGGVSSNKPVSEIQVFSGDNELGSTILEADGTWNFTVGYDHQQGKDITAKAVYTDNTSEKSNDLLLLPNIPLDYQTVGFIQGTANEISATVYGARGRPLYDLTASFGDGQGLIDTTSRGGPSTAYADFRGSAEFIEGFRASGPHHDTLNLSDTGFQTLAGVLQHTTVNDGSATIHIDDQTSVTLVGVTKQQIANHSHDIVLTGGHDLAPQLM